MLLALVSPKMTGSHVYGNIEMSIRNASPRLQAQFMTLVPFIFFCLSFENENAAIVIQIFKRSKIDQN